MLLLRSVDVVRDRAEILGKQCPREFAMYAPRICPTLLAASSDLWNSALKAIHSLQTEKLPTLRCLCPSSLLSALDKWLTLSATVLSLLFRFLASVHGPLYFADDVKQGMSTCLHVASRLFVARKAVEESVPLTSICSTAATLLGYLSIRLSVALFTCSAVNRQPLRRT